MILELYRLQTFDQPISTLTSNYGTYRWWVPSTLENRPDYRIKISNVLDASEYDFSDSVFTVGTVVPEVIFPGEGDTLEPGLTYPILYEVSQAFSRVAVELVVDNEWVSTVVNYDNNDGFTTWSIPTSFDPSTKYQLGIRNYYAPYDTIITSGFFMLDTLSHGSSTNFEPNDTTSTAHGPLEANTQYISYISPTNDEDYYYVTINRFKKMTLYLIVPSGRDYDFHLFNNAGIQISSDTGSGNRVMNNSLFPGKYYVKVNGVSGSADGINHYILLFFEQL